jgi:UDP-N-acetylmuramate dehydrogenase
MLSLIGNLENAKALLKYLARLRLAFYDYQFKKFTFRRPLQAAIAVNLYFEMADGIYVTPLKNPAAEHPPDAVFSPPMFPPEVPVLQNEPLSKHTSYRIGGPARHFALPRTKQHLFALGRFLLESQEPYFLLGNGSNVLAPDEGFPGVVICTRDLESILEFLPENRVRASAGTLNARLLRACAEKGLSGIDALSGVPGNVGGAVLMNAGTAVGWIAQALESVEALNLRGGERLVRGEGLRYSYREQHFLIEGDIVWAATLKLTSDDPSAIRARLAEAVKRRKAAQPIELPSCGSVFRNPEGKNAWKLIDEAGLRGLAKGGARISAKHSNFIVNEGGATRADVLFLIQTAKEKAYNQCGIRLQEEVILLSPKILGRS